MGLFSARKRKEVELDFNLNLDPENSPEKQKFEKDREWHRGLAETLIALAVLGVTFLTCEMVFKGLFAEQAREKGASLQSGLMALSISVGLTLAIFVGFYISMKLTPLMSTRPAYFGAWIATLVFCAWAVGTSSWYSFMGTSGQSALAMHLVDTANRLSKAVAVATEQIKIGRAMPEAMEAKAAGFSSRHLNEISTGSGTGAKGAGPVSQTLGGAAAVLNKGAEGIRAAVAKADLDAAVLRERVRAVMVAVSDRKKSVAEREDEFQRGAADVQALLGGMNDTGLVEIVRATLAAVKSSVAELPADNSALGQRQRDFIASIRADMQTVASDLEAVVRGLEGVKKEVSGTVEMVSLSEIAWDYKHRFIPALIISIGLDLFAPWALAFMAVYSVKGRKRDRRSKFQGFLELDEVVGREILKPEVLRKLPVMAAPGEIPSSGEEEPKSEAGLGLMSKARAMVGRKLPAKTAA